MSPIISALIAAVIVAPITWLAAVAYRKKSYESKIGSAEEKSREIIDEALKVAETKKKEALLEAKEENLKAKMSWRRKPGNEGQRFSAMSAAYSAKRKIWIKKQRQWNGKSPAWCPERTL